MKLSLKRKSDSFLKKWPKIDIKLKKSKTYLIINGKIKILM